MVIMRRLTVAATVAGIVAGMLDFWLAGYCLLGMFFLDMSRIVRRRAPRRSP